MPPVKPIVTVSAQRDAYTEGETARFTINLDREPASRIAVHFAFVVNGDYGVSNLDANGVGIFSAPFIPNDATTTDLAATTRVDGVAEADGRITVVLLSGDGYTVGSSDRVSVPILDADSARPTTPSVRVDVGGNGQDGTISENMNGVGNNVGIGFFVRADVGGGDNPGPNQVLTAPIDVTFALGGTATLGTDYKITVDGTEHTARSTLPSTVTIRPNAPKHADILLDVINDNIEDGGETVTVTVASGTGYTLDADTTKRTATWTIENHDPVEDDTQSDDNAGYTPDAAIVAEVTAKRDGFDASHPAHGRLDKILKGIQGGAGGYTAAECREVAEDFGVLGTWGPWCDEIERRENWTPPAQQQTPDPEPTPPPTPVVSITEGSGITEGGNAVFTLTANPAPDADLSVDVVVSQQGNYGVTTGTQTVTIGAGGTATLTIATTGDDADEPDGSITATVSSGTGYDVGAAASASVAVSDDDDPAPAVFVPDTALVAEVTAKRDGFAPSHGAHGRLDKVLKGMLGEAGGYTAAECREVAASFGVTSTWGPWCAEIERRENWTPPAQQ